MVNDLRSQDPIGSGSQLAAIALRTNPDSIAKPTRRLIAFERPGSGHFHPRTIPLLFIRERPTKKICNVRKKQKRNPTLK